MEKIRKSKFENEEERRKSVLQSKRNYYHRNEELYKLKSLRTYYVNQLAKTDLNEKKRENYQNKLNEIDVKLIDLKPIKKNKN